MVGRKFDYIHGSVEFYRELGELLMATRQKLGLSQKDVAQQVGITFQQIQKYESGENRVPIYVLYKMARIYGVSFANIFDADLIDCDYRVLDADRTRALIDDARARLDELQEFLAKH